MYLIAAGSAVLVRFELKSQIGLQELAIFKIVWDGLIDSIPEGILDLEDNQEFNYKAELNHLPFRFQEDFKLEILLDN
ncbi:hypothetical protein ACEYW6_30935 [Nostoc sp. UIC 10607]|uniref:hypothetical protein n=1 Tax=Nostoc sp. UIC 10607 TaxID=3045935 RepID=UPI0039A2247B